MASASAAVVGPRKREIGFVALVKFTVVTKELRVATVPSKEMIKRKNKIFIWNRLLMILKL